MRKQYTLRLLLPLCCFVAVTAGRSRVFPGPSSQELSVGSPQCPNGQPPRLDKKGFAIQCLPGADQYAVCGPMHTCFFSGLNYMCCPTNEPPPGAQPVCPGGLATIVDSIGNAVKCIPGRRACPGGGHLCLNAGRDYVCCERRMASVDEPSPQMLAEQEALEAEQLLQQVMEESMQTAAQSQEIREHVRRKQARPPAPEQHSLSARLVCPPSTLAALGSDGSPIKCSKQRCPQESHICHGSKKRSICCQRVVDTTHSPFAEKKPAAHNEVAVTRLNNAPKQSPNIGLKRRKMTQTRGSAKVDNRQRFLNEVQHVHDAEVPRKAPETETTTSIATSTTTTTTETTTISTSTEKSSTTEFLTTSPQLIVYEAITTTQTPEAQKKRKRRPLSKSIIPTSDMAPRNATSQERNDDKEDLSGTGEVEQIIAPRKMWSMERSYESGETIFRNLHRGSSTEKKSSTGEPQFARARALGSKTFGGVPRVQTTNERRLMAQQFLMRQIRDGWPYHDRFYRSDYPPTPTEAIFAH